MLELRASRIRRVTKIFEDNFVMSIQERFVSTSRRPQTVIRLRRQRQDVDRINQGVDDLGRRRGLFHYDMGVCSAKPERTHARATRTFINRPCVVFGGYQKSCSLNRQVRVGLFVMEDAGNLSA